MNRRFYLIDRENGNEKIRITMRNIVAHFVGDGTGPVRWNAKNVDLDRFRDEMDEIGYTFVVERGPSSHGSELARLRSLEARLRTAGKKLEEFRRNWPQGDVSDRACRKYMNAFLEQLRKFERLQVEVSAARWKYHLETPHGIRMAMRGIKEK